MSEAKSILMAGKPMTWARAKNNWNKGAGKPVYFTADDRKAKMEEVAYLWMAAGHGRMEGPLSIECEFVFDRPKAHFNAAGAVKPQHRRERPGKGKYGGDIDNLVKLIQDALNTVAYRDDAEIADLWARKRYATNGEICHTRVTLETLYEEPWTMPSLDQLTIELG